MSKAWSQRSSAAPMNTTPPAVAIGPPRLGEPHSAGIFAACSGGSSRAGEPSGTSHSRRAAYRRSEEHTSELQSPCNLVCRLLLEKKKKQRDTETLPER